MRLKPSLIKVVISLLVGVGFALLLFILSLFMFDYSPFILVGVFVVVSVLVYLVWSMTQPEFEPWE